MNHQKDNPADKDPVKFLKSVHELTYGLEGQETLTPDEIRQELKASGVDVDKGWKDLQSILKNAEGQARLAEARQARLKSAAQSSQSGGLVDTIESVKQQIAGFLALSGQASVYARKWENSSLEDLITLRDQLARTAARAAQRKDGPK
jgi:hypothetical protein